MDKKKKRKKRFSLYNCVLFLLIAVFLGCAIYLGLYFLASKKSEDRVDELKSLIVEEPVMDEQGQELPVDMLPPLTYETIDGVKVQSKFVNLYKKNTDFIGWLTLEDTNIDYPVMQSMGDEEFYLHRDFDKESSNAGTLFADTESDFRRPDDNIIIYGHNMKTGKMFHDLLSYEDESFYQNHKYIQFDTLNGNATYEVIAAFRAEVLPVESTGFKYYQFIRAGNAEQFQDYVKNCKERTPYTIETGAEYGDKLITLSTCAYHDKNGRYVVVAKRILWRE